MSAQTTPSLDLSAKIVGLARHHGWNLEEFSRRAKLNRQTGRRILRGEPHRLRRATVARCAAAFGLTVSELCDRNQEQLLSLVQGRNASPSDDSLQRRYEQASQPELQVWLQHNPRRAERLDAEELDELYSLQGVGGPLTENGAEHCVAEIERRRELLHKVRAIAGTEQVEMLEKIVELMYEKIRPYAGRK